MGCHPRSEWAVRHPSFTPMGPVDTIFFHHFVSPQYAAYTPELMRSAEQTAMNAQPDLIAMPYHRLWFANGDCGEGRPWGVRGGATYNWNDRSYAWCWFGNFEHDTPTEASLVSAADEIREGIDGGFILPDFTIRPHYDVYPTACPGDHLAARIPYVRDLVIEGDDVTPDELTKQLQAQTRTIVNEHLNNEKSEFRQELRRETRNTVKTLLAPVYEALGITPPKD